MIYFEDDDDELDQMTGSGVHEKSEGRSRQIETVGRTGCASEKMVCGIKQLGEKENDHCWSLLITTSRRT